MTTDPEPWDVLDAELADTIEAERYRPEPEPCDVCRGRGATAGSQGHAPDCPESPWATRTDEGIAPMLCDRCGDPEPVVFRDVDGDTFGLCRRCAELDAVNA